MKNSRRSFLTQATIGALATLTIPQIAAAAVAESGGFKAGKVKLQPNDIILFQGDSITDSGRSKNVEKPPAPNSSGMLGNGYAFIATSQLLMDHADKNLTIYNKGISGNKVYQLAERWDNDALSIKPNVLSIHIGVNDYWHTLTGGYKGTLETYVGDLKKLLDRTKTALPDVKLIICEPFGVLNVSSVTPAWYPTFDTYRKAAADIAKEYDAPFVPYQAAFDKAITIAPPKYWTGDGVHPSVAGAALMAHTWLEAVK